MNPVAPVAPAAAVAAMPGATEFPAESVPAGLRTLAPGTRIAASVAEVLAADRVRLATPFGAVVVRTPTPLPAGAPLVLSLQGRAPALSFRLIGPLPALPGLTGSGGTPATPTATAAVATTLIAGGPVRATLLSPATAAGSVPGGAGTAAGVALQARLWPGTAEAPAGSPPARSPARSPGGSPAADPGPAPAGKPPTVLAGIVLAARDGGRAVIQTPAGLIAVELREPPPAGTRITVELITADRPARPDGPGPFLAAAEATEPPVLPARSEAAAVLAALDPGFARQGPAVAAAPGQDNRLAATLILALALLRGGGGGGGGGGGAAEPLLPALPRLAPAVRARVGEALREAVRPGDDPASGGGWRLLSLPLAGEGLVAPIRFACRDPGDNADAAPSDDSPASTTRFLVDICLSRLGRLQLDALVGSGGRHLDLLVRSTGALQGEVRDGIRAAFRDTGARTGLSGSVGFRVEPDGFADPWRTAVPPAGPGIVI